MSLPYFNLYGNDFEADTAHLGLEEDGAFNRLMRLMWRTPGCSVPFDAVWIARKMRIDIATYERVVKPLIAEFMEVSSGRVFSPRLLREFKKVDETSRKRSRAGKMGGRPKVIDITPKDEKPGNDFAYVGLSDTRALPDPDPDIEDAPDDYTRGEPTFREKLLAAMGVDKSGMTGRSGTRLGSQADMAEADRWQQMPLMTEDAIAAEIAAVMAKKRDGPPSSFKYFTQAMAALSAALAAPQPEGGSNGPRRAKGTGRDAESLSRIIHRAIDQREGGD